MLHGGGEEQKGGWSDAPYRWVIEQAPNHQIAILSLDPQSDWLAHYLDELGADSVANFVLGSLSDSALIHQLANFDAWILRDGASRLYLQHFKDQALGQALIRKYESGGVIVGCGESMQLLSSVYYVPRSGMAPTEACLKDIHHPDLSLQTHFLPFYRGFLFEARFSERGGLGRMLASMARWQEERQEKLFGVGIDDKTALCLQADGKGTVYGTGAAQLFIPDQSEVGFRVEAGKASIDSLRIASLLHGQSFDFISWAPINTRSAQQWTLTPQKEQAQINLWLSGSEALSDNVAFLEEVNQAQGDSSLPIMIISSYPSSTREALGSLLGQMGAEEIWWLDPATASQNDANVALQISQTRKLIFCGNQDSSLKAFFAGEGNGRRLWDRIFVKGVSAAFMGQDSRLVGKCYLNNYQTPYASYDGILKLTPGLALLQHSILVPQVDGESALLENKLTGLSYAMVKDSLSFGIWLPEQSWGQYAYEDGQALFKGVGVPVLHQHRTRVSLAPGFDGIARNVAGYESMQLSWLQGQSLIMGRSTTTHSDFTSQHQDWISVYPNPFDDHLKVFLYGEQSGSFDFHLFNEKGQSIFRKSYQLSPLDTQISIPLPRLPRGVYLLQVNKNGQGIVKQLQLLH